MDRFKFRAWNRHKNWMQPLGHFGINEKGLPTVPWEKGEAGELTLMQCTGLKDKNGKLIYEGDIVEYEYHNDDTTEVSELWDVVEWEEGAFFPVPQVKPCITGRALKFEIIGNIYENPELLAEARHGKGKG